MLYSAHANDTQNRTGQVYIHNIIVVLPLYYNYYTHTIQITIMITVPKLYIPRVKCLLVMMLTTVDNVVTPTAQFTSVPFRPSPTELISNVDTKGAALRSEVREKMNLVELICISVEMLLVETDRLIFVAFPGIAIIQSTNTRFIVATQVNSSWSSLHTCAIP